ncbi:MAG: carboxypeptidase-like regulatory domain-containing protein, partial [Chloroflexota bacterium]
MSIPFHQIHAILFDLDGTLVDTDDTALIGVTVMIKGTTIGTITDIKGNFTLEYTGENPVLVISYVGMRTQEVTVTGDEPLNIVMVESFLDLDEVVVIGYGVQKKQSVVGAISVVAGDELQRTGGVTN